MTYHELARELRDLADWAERDEDRASLIRAAEAYARLAAGQDLSPRPMELDQ